MFLSKLLGFPKKKMSPEEIATELGGLGPYPDPDETPKRLYRTDDIENPFEEADDHMPVVNEQEAKSIQDRIVKAETPAYYVLFTQDGEPTAIGPFINKRDAKLWLAGFKYFERDDLVIFGVVAEFDPKTADIERPAFE